MNLIEIAEDLKDVPDQYLMQEIQQPTGNFPSYLVVSELSRRKRMREKVAKEMPTQTVAEELATPPQPQMPQGMPQMATQGLMAMPQAQTELAAQDAMGTTPPEMMMPTQQMAGGGMVSFKQGGDVIRAFDGFPEEMYEDTGPTRRGIFPSIGDFFQGGFYNDIQALERLGYTDAQISQMTPAQRAEIAGQARSSLPPAVAPATVAPAAVTQTTAPAGAPAGAPASAPSGIPGAAPRAVVPQIAVPSAVELPVAMTPAQLQDIRTKGTQAYEQAVPDRLAPFIADTVARREREIEGRRGSNINEALIQAGLGIMGSKSPRFLQAASEGGLSALKSYREGAKDLRQSEEALLAARSKMVEAQMLRDDRKFKAAEDAEKRALELDKIAVDRANTQSAINLRTLQANIAAQKAPAEIGVLQAQEYAYRNRPAGVDKTIANPDQIAQAKIRAMTELASSGVKKPSQAQIDAAMDAILAQSGLRRAGGGLTQLPAAIDRGTI